MTELGRIPLPAGIAVRFLVVSPDGRQLTAAGGDRKLRVWALPPAPDYPPLRMLDVGGEPISSIAYSRDGKWMAAGTAKGTVGVFRADSGEAVNRFPTTEMGRAERVRALALSSDGSRLAVSRLGVPAELWDVSGGSRRAVLATRFGGSLALDFAPDGTRLASADQDTAVRLYDAEGKLRAIADDFLLESFALTFTADGTQLLVAGADKTVTVLDGSTAAVRRQLPRQKHPILWLAAFGNGATVVTGSSQEESARLPGPTLAWPLDGSAPRVVVTDRAFNGGGPVADGSVVLTSLEGGAIVVWAVREPITLKEPARP
jgi:WD40 repeat protein